SADGVASAELAVRRLERRHDQLRKSAGAHDDSGSNAHRHVHDRQLHSERHDGGQRQRHQDAGPADVRLGHEPPTARAVRDGVALLQLERDTTSFSNPLVLTMRSNHDIVATFTINMYALTITVRGNGTVTKQPSLPTYPYGSVVQVTAIPDPGYHLSSWSGASGGTTNPLNITMDGNKALIATFKAT